VPRGVQESKPMKHKLTLAILFFAVMPGVVLCQTTNTPLNHAEILGRLAAGASRSYIAHLVKTRGVNFSSDAHYLSLISRAGGNGILFQRLSDSNAGISNGSFSNEDPPFEHLARCAELIQLGSINEAETACRASIDENPASPWAILATLRAVQQKTPKPPDVVDLARRAAALAPNVPDAHFYLANALPRDDVHQQELFAEIQKASAIRNELAASDPLSSLASDGDYFFNQHSDARFRTGEDIDAQLQRLLNIEPDFAPTHISVAVLCESLSQPDRALAEMHEALRLEPDNAQLHAAFADFYRDAGNVESQVAELREAIRCEPNGSSHRLDLARTFQELGRLPDAITELKNLLAIDPVNSFASAILVDIALDQKNRTLAIEELRRFLKATSIGVDEFAYMTQTWDESYRLAEVLHHDGQLEAAVAQYLEMLRFRPEDGGVHNDYGNVLMDQNKLEAATAQYREALQYEPDLSAARNNLGVCLMRKRDFDAAVAEYNAALNLNPEEPNTRIWLGIALGSKGDLEGAISEFKRALSENPEDAFAHASLGHAFELKNDPASAIPELKRALELNPDIRATENDLAWLYATASDPRYRDQQAALSHARHAVTLLQRPPVPSGEESAAYFDTLAEALLLNGQAKEALATEERAASLDQKNPEIQKRLERFRKAALVPGPKPR